MTGKITIPEVIKTFGKEIFISVGITTLATIGNLAVQQATRLTKDYLTSEKLPKIRRNKRRSRRT